MSRFNFEPLPPIEKVTAAEGKPYAVTFEVPAPVGKYWGDLSIELVEIVDKFRELAEGQGASEIAAMQAFRMLRENKKFWDEYLPAVLGIKGQKDEKEGQAYLRKFLTIREQLDLFMDASVAIVNYSFSGNEVEEALEKSEGGEVAVEESPLVLDGTTQPA